MSNAETVLPAWTYTPSSDASEFLFSRATEAQRIAEFVIKELRGGATTDGPTARTKLVLLCGHAAGGKTTLVQRWLIPALRQANDLDGYGIYYGQCAPRLPDRVAARDGDAGLTDALNEKSIVIIDEFDRVLEASREERKQQLDALFAALRGAHREAIVLSVVSMRQLTSTYALTSYDPHITTAVCPIESVGLIEALLELTEEQGDSIECYTQPLLKALSDDAQKLQEKDLDVTFDLVRLLRARFKRLRVEDDVAVIDLPHYTKMGRLFGMLREHLNGHLEQLASTVPGPTDKLGRAILLRIRESQLLYATPDLLEVARRFDVKNEYVREVRDGLAAPGGLLQPAGTELYEFVPPHLAVVVDEDAASDKVLNDRAVRVVQDGLRGWQLTGTYLPEGRFVDLHRQRRYLVADDELTRFLLRCALRATSAELDDAARYWAGRIKQREDAIDVLLGATLETDSRVRLRAAGLLEKYCEKLVCDRLTVLALTDQVEAIRHAAVTSLKGMADEALLNRLLAEVKNPNSAIRDNAIYVLRIYPRDDVTAVLKWLVNAADTPEALRGRAVSVLAVLNTPAALDTLVDIALNDEDQVDRQAAAKALASADSKVLNDHILERLDWRRPTRRLVAAQIALGLVLVMASIVALTVIVMALPRAAGPAWTWFLLIVLLPLPAGMLYARLKDGRLQLMSSGGIAAIALFSILAVTITPFIHGLAHATARRWQRALMLFTLELVGLFVLIVVAGATEFLPKWGEPLAVSYRLLGGALFIGTYLWDVLGVARTLFLLRSAAVRDARRAAIYGEVFRNPAMADAVFDDLRDDNAASVGRARKLIKRYGGQIPPAYLLERFFRESGTPDKYVAVALSTTTDEYVVAQLEKRWRATDIRRRRAIIAILAAKASERSTAALAKIAPSEGWLVRARAIWARARFTFGVLPWQVYLTIASLIPFLGVLFYHGWMMSQNPAWGPIIQLSAAPWSVGDRQVKIVNFLADAYPRESAPELRMLFQEGSQQPVTPRHAAIARGLTVIHDSLPHADRVQLRADLAAQLPRFDSLLANPNDARFDLGLGVLRSTANMSDTALAAVAVGKVLWFVDSIAHVATTADSVRKAVAARSVMLDSLDAQVQSSIDSLSHVSSTLARRQRLVIEALGSLRYSRALPALDSLLQLRPTGKAQAQDTLATLIKEQITQVAKVEYASLPSNRKDERARLLQMLQRLSYKPVEVITPLELEATEDARGCDRDRDGKCDGKDEALAYIARYPKAESAYRALFGEFAADSQYMEASVAFEGLIGILPRSVWARKLQAEIYHEYLAVNDTTYFARSYDEMVALRELPTFAELATSAKEDHERVEADFVETALSARRYAVTDRRSRAVLRTTTDDVIRLNMTVFLYMSAVMRGDVDSSYARLNELEQVVNALPAHYDNGWRYPGTRAFIRGSDLSPALKDALERWCKEDLWYSPTEMAAVIAQNRDALSTLPVRTRR